MTRARRRVCIIEPRHNHEEVIFPQIDYLHEEFDVSVVAPQALLDVDLLRRTTGLYQPYAIPSDNRDSKWKKLAMSVRKYRLVRAATGHIRPDVVIFNTTYRLMDLLLVARFFGAVAKVQIIHEFRPFLSPPHRSLYRKFSQNLVLSEDVCEFVRSRHPEFSGLDYFRPTSFAGFCAPLDELPAVFPDADRVIHVGVFGTVETARRNYRGLLERLARMKASGNEPPVRIHIVGKSPRWVVEYVRDRGLGEFVELSGEFVTFERLFQVLKAVDLVLFLIDRNVKYCDESQPVQDHGHVHAGESLQKGRGVLHGLPR